jgi:amidophosphoribosyltransferase
MRRRAGEHLAGEAPAEADIAIGVPDSGLSAAMGYAERSGLPFEMGLMRNRYASRTFIQPTDRLRGDSVRLKLSALASVVRGRRIAVVDDSIVRGTTSRRIVNLLREAGAREVHLRIASPPVRFPCHYGIDTGRPGELVAARLDPVALAREIGCDSLAFLSLEGLLAEGGGRPGTAYGYCDGCFSGRYPTPVAPTQDKFGIENELAPGGRSSPRGPADPKEVLRS